MKIEITEEKIIYCDGILCDPLSMYITCDECGSCPVIEICEKFFEIKLDSNY